MKRSWLIAAAAAVAAAVVGSAPTWSQGGPGTGWGPGYGYGMMGPGMMDRGMMGSYGPGFGMGGWGWGVAIDLTPQQRKQIAEIRQETARQHWQLMSKLHEQGGPMYQAYASGEFDEQAARKAYDAMAQTHKQMFESGLDARKRIESMLTEEQKKQLRSAQ